MGGLVNPARPLVDVWNGALPPPKRHPVRRQVGPPARLGLRIPVSFSLSILVFVSARQQLSFFEKMELTLSMVIPISANLTAAMSDY